jgi:hypothetical protein
MTNLGESMADCVSTGRTEDLFLTALSQALLRARTPHREPPTEPPDGTLGGACYGNQTCNAGLTCDTRTRCVAAPVVTPADPPADPAPAPPPPPTPPP